MPGTEGLVSLDLIGIAEGTDRHSLHLDYLRQYERMFAPFRHEPIDLMEIGVFRGGSLRMWRRFFSRARIIGVDIDPHCVRHARENEDVIVEIGSQRDAEFCSYLADKYRPTIIIDDGSHLAFDVQFTFERLFPSLRPGGCYAIEDIIFHFGAHAEKHAAGAAVSLPGYLDRVQQRLLGEAVPPDASGFQLWSAGVIDRLEVFKSGAAIWRKPEKIEPDIRQIEELMAAADTASGWHHFAQLMLDRGALDQAERAARRAIAIEGRNWEFPARLSVVLARKRDMEGAIAALRSAIPLVTAQSVKQRLQARLDEMLARSSGS